MLEKEAPDDNNDEVKRIRVLQFNRLLQTDIAKHYGSQFSWYHMYLIAEDLKGRLPGSGINT